MHRKRILFICFHNSCRSTMAEGLVNHYLSERYHALSAGIEPKRVNPEAVACMHDLGIDISTHQPCPVTSLAEERFDLVVCLSQQARQHLPPTIAGVIPEFWSFPSPVEEQQDIPSTLRFRGLRDSLKQTILANL